MLDNYYWQNSNRDFKVWSKVLQWRCRYMKKKSIVVMLIISMLLNSCGTMSEDNEQEQEKPIVTKYVENKENVGSPSKERTHDDMGVKSGALNLPCNIVWNNRLYEVQADTTLKTLKESDLGKEYHKTLNGVTVTVYSLKNIPIEESVAYKRNNAILQYNCIYNQVFNVNGKEYGLVDWMYYRYPEPEKGEYLREVNNKKIYKFVGNDKAVLIDMTSNIGAVDDEEYLFVAEVLE